MSGQGLAKIFKKIFVLLVEIFSPPKVNRAGKQGGEPVRGAYSLPPVCTGYLPQSVRNILALEADLTAAGITGVLREQIIEQIKNYQEN